MVAPIGEVEVEAAPGEVVTVAVIGVGPEQVDQAPQDPFVR